ncbi:hypothetical protein GQ42DRAFT_168306 [Ramicandelaber brevisporus]|nr:hypothetical protein GQ42DRAFT_168306 [Ramicandelaber brevisporus]
MQLTFSRFHTLLLLQPITLIVSILFALSVVQSFICSITYKLDADREVGTCVLCPTPQGSPSHYCDIVCSSKMTKLKNDGFECKSDFLDNKCSNSALTPTQASTIASGCRFIDGQTGWRWYKSDTWDAEIWAAGQPPAKQSTSIGFESWLGDNYAGTCKTSKKAVRQFTVKQLIGHAFTTDCTETSFVKTADSWSSSIRCDVYHDLDFEHVCEPVTKFCKEKLEGYMEESEKCIELYNIKEGCCFRSPWKGIGTWNKFHDGKDCSCPFGFVCAECNKDVCDY